MQANRGARHVESVMKVQGQKYFDALVAAEYGIAMERVLRLKK